MLTSTIGLTTSLDKSNLLILMLSPRLDLCQSISPQNVEAGRQEKKKIEAER